MCMSLAVYYDYVYVIKHYLSYRVFNLGSRKGYTAVLQ